MKTLMTGMSRTSLNVDIRSFISATTVACARRQEEMEEDEEPEIYGSGEPLFDKDFNKELDKLMYICLSSNKSEKTKSNLPQRRDSIDTLHIFNLDLISEGVISDIVNHSANCMTCKKKELIPWILDSGALLHFIFEKADFNFY